VLLATALGLCRDAVEVHVHQALPRTPCLLLDSLRIGDGACEVEPLLLRASVHGVLIFAVVTVSKLLLTWQVKVLLLLLLFIMVIVVVIVHIVDEVLELLLIDQEGVQYGELIGLLDVEVEDEALQGELDLFQVGRGCLELGLELHKALDLVYLQVRDVVIWHVHINAAEDIDVVYVVDHHAHLPLVVHDPAQCLTRPQLACLEHERHLRLQVTEYLFAQHLLIA
jgi:hypothetical protein